MAEYDDQHSRVPESVFLVSIQHNTKIVSLYITNIPHTNRAFSGLSPVYRLYLSRFASTPKLPLSVDYS
jgi:hypothetical protein